VWSAYSCEYVLIFVSEPKHFAKTLHFIVPFTSHTSDRSP